MENFLYSRWRIRLFNIKKDRKSRVKRLFIIIVVGILFLICLFLYASYPIFVASCNTAAGSLATRITNEEIAEIMKNCTYNELVNIEKDEKGDIILLELNSLKTNMLVSEIISKIQSRIDTSPRTKVYINLGTVTGISKLGEFIGPRFEIELETSGLISGKISTEFQSVGINHTLHKVYLDLNTSLGVLTPYGNFSREFQTSVLLTQAVIVGNVPFEN